MICLKDECFTAEIVRELLDTKVQCESFLLMDIPIKRSTGELMGLEANGLIHFFTVLNVNLHEDRTDCCIRRVDAEYPIEIVIGEKIFNGVLQTLLEVFKRTDVIVLPSAWVPHEACLSHIV